MTHLQPPFRPDDILRVPQGEVPDLIRSLIDRRALSQLVRALHHDMQSNDPTLRSKGRLALQHMGFPDDQTL